MRVVCCACGIHLGDKPSGALAEDAVSHGLCKPCAHHFLAQVGMPLADYLKGIPAPVVAVSPEGTIGMANPNALELLGKTPAQIQGLKGGTVFECEYAKQPAGCGQSVHCSGCAIRNAVMDTMNTCTPHDRVPAYLKQRSRGRTGRFNLLITTEKKAGVVLLKVEGLVDAAPIEGARDE